MNRCLFCYKPLLAQENDFHAACSKKIFGQPEPPILIHDENEVELLALELVRSHVAVTGVQPKLSLNFTNDGNSSKRLTIVGVLGQYILKIPVTQYPQLPEVEDVTMHLATLAKIKTVPHSLIRLRSGNLAYITKRIDRQKKDKIHMEDMCQLTERMTEDKYRGSYEQIGKAIWKYSYQPGLDIINFCEQILFSFLTGNADMHLKNFSLIYNRRRIPILAPAYDMVSTVLVNPADEEDLALTLNGKKKKISRDDFTAAFTTLRLNSRQQQNIFSNMEKAFPAWHDCINNSFISDQYKIAYKDLINTRFRRLL